MDLKFFTKENNNYKMKPQFGIGIFSIGGFLLFAFLGYYVNRLGIMWVMLVCAIISFITLKNKKLTLDMTSKKIYAKIGLVSPAVTIAIDSIQSFELYTVSNNFIKTNAMLNVYYLDNNKKLKSIQIAQGFTSSAMQKIINEIEEIIQNHEIKG